MYLHILFTILVFSIPTLTKPTPNTEWSKFDELIIAMGGYIVNHQITLYNFIKALKKCGSIYDNLAINWFESGLTGEQMLNIEPLLILVTNNFDNQLIKKIEFVYKTLNNNNDGQIDILKYRAISILCGIPINTSSEHDKLLIAIGGYIVNQQISLNNFIKVLKNFGSEYDNFAKKWIESGLDGEQMLNVEPLLILATNNFENQSIKKTEFVYKTLKNNNDGKIDILKYRSIYNLSDIPLDTSSEHDKLLIAMGGYIVNQQITLNNFIKVLKNFGSKYDKFAKKWIESGLEDERMLNIEPLLILVTDDFENQSIKKTEFVYKALNNNNDGKIDVLDDRIIGLLFDIPIDTNNKREELMIAMGEYIVNQQITLNNFIKALKKFGSKYDKFAKKWIESGLEGERMLNVEPLLKLATDNFAGQPIKRIATIFKAVDSNNDGKISFIEGGNICLLCDISIDTYLNIPYKGKSISDYILK